jgi:hypothetical protein
MADNEFHPHTMPELIRWFQWLSARLRHVRILNGDWSRTVTNAASKTLNVRMGDGHAGIFLDPPYADTANRSSGLYGVDDLDVAHLVKEWCAKNGDDPDRRIILAGYDGEHDNQLADLGWTAHEWFAAGYLQGGYGKASQQHRERLWASPHCLNRRSTCAHTRRPVLMTNHPAAPQQHCYQCGKAVTPGIDHDTADVRGIRWWCPEHCPQCRESPTTDDT